VADVTSGTEASGWPTRLASSGPTSLAILVASVNVVLFSLVSLAGWASWGGAAHAAAGGDHGAATVATEAAAVFLVNLGYGALVVAIVYALHPFAHRWGVRVALVVGAAVVAAPLRALALAALHTTPTGTLYTTVEWVVGAAAGAVAVGAGLVTAALVDRARTESRRRDEERARAERAVQELQDEELRVRRMVADQLHGTLQFRLVTVTAALDALAAELTAAGDAAHAQDARTWANALDEIREEDVRSLSHALFPTGADLSAAQAIEVLLDRLPPTIRASIEIGDTYRHMIDAQRAPLPMAERLVAVYTVEEAVTNALKHGRAQAVRVQAEATPTDVDGRWVFEVTVDDDGAGLAEPRPPLHGLERHRQRIEQRGGTLELTGNPAGKGARLRFTLPFARPTT
jgi:signal transduction histidine kinase